MIKIDRFGYRMSSPTQPSCRPGKRLDWGDEPIFEGKLMTIASSKEIVRRYFSEAVDKQNIDILDDLWTPDCVVHRPERFEPLRGLEELKRGLKKGVIDPYSKFATTIHDLIAEGDLVSCRLSHRAVHRADWTSRLGRHAVAVGQTISWSSITNFRICDQKI